MTVEDVVVIPSGGTNRRRRAIAVGIVLLVVVAGGAVAWRLIRGGADVPVARPAWTGTAVGCPSTVDHPASDGVARAIPALPPAPTMPGLDERLVPVEAPRAVTLCEFDVAPGTAFGDPAVAAAGVPLTRTAEFGEDDAAFRGLMTALQGAPVPGEGLFLCAGWVVGGGAGPDHLIGLTYDDGVVWLAVGPIDCPGTGNAEFHSELDVRERVVAMLAGTAPVPDPDEPCTAVGSPRPGTADRFVPFTPTEVLGLPRRAGLPRRLDLPARRVRRRRRAAPRRRGRPAGGAVRPRRGGLPRRSRRPLGAAVQPRG